MSQNRNAGGGKTVSRAIYVAKISGKALRRAEAPPAREGGTREVVRAADRGEGGLLAA